MPNGTPQTIGGAITYARRYALLAVTGVAPDDDDDDGQAAEDESQEVRALQQLPPETRADGSATEAEQMRMNTGRVPGTWRATSTAENDPQYDNGRTQEQTRQARQRQMFKLLHDLDVIGDEAQRDELSTILDRKIESRGTLNLSELTTVCAILRRRVEKERHQT